MEARGLRQIDLAKLLSVHASTVGRWCDGTSIPDGGMASYLAARLGVDVDWLIRGKENPNASRNPLRLARERAGISMRDLAQRTKYSLGVLLAVLLPALASAEPPASPPPKVVRVVGKCQGGNHPSIGCKTCKDCAYCGPKRHPGGTCAVCARAKDF